METYPAPPDFEELGYRKFRLTQAYRYEGPGWVITIPAGFVCDLASVPRIVWFFISPLDLTFVAALLHDFLYRYAGAPPGLSVLPCGTRFTRKGADQLFRTIMVDRAVSAWRQRAAYHAVRVFGRYPAK